MTNPRLADRPLALTGAHSQGGAAEDAGQGGMLSVEVLLVFYSVGVPSPGLAA
ncbi:MAG: hypothetical protein ACLQVF_11600 [Isosphaeraceae bacterium]